VRQVQVLDAEVVALVEGGCGLIVATVGHDGSPHATRGWGLDVVSAEPCRVRFLLDADDTRARDDLAGGHPIAITCADVPTLRSVQLKGTSAGVAPAVAGDDERKARYAGAFYSDIHSTDGTPMHVLVRITPDEVVAVLVDVVEVFDQTPGPGAGRAVGATR
jgi:hypothetical protein